jgi:hypothetical protein
MTCDPIESRCNLECTADEGVDPVRAVALHEANRAVPFPEGMVARSAYRAEIIATAREFEAYLRGDQAGE